MLRGQAKDHVGGAAGRVGHNDGDRLLRIRDRGRRGAGKRCQEAGVSASTLTRMAQGRRSDVDSLSRLTTWSGLKADDFISQDGRRTHHEPDALAQITALLRADAHLSKDAATALEIAMKTMYERLRGDRER